MRAGSARQLLGRCRPCVLLATDHLETLCILKGVLLEDLSFEKRFHCLKPICSFSRRFKSGKKKNKKKPVSCEFLEAELAKNPIAKEKGAPCSWEGGAQQGQEAGFVPERRRLVPGPRSHRAELTALLSREQTE